MVIEMNEAQVRTVEQVRQVRQVLEGTQVLQFRAAQDDEGRYGWIEAVLRRLRYRQLQRADRGARAAAPQDHNEQGKAFAAWQPLARWAVDKAQARVKQAVAVPPPHGCAAPAPSASKKARSNRRYTGTCPQRIDSLRIADLKSLQTHT